MGFSCSNKADDDVVVVVAEVVLERGAERDDDDDEVDGSGGKCDARGSIGSFEKS